MGLDFETRFFRIFRYVNMLALRAKAETEWVLAHTLICSKLFFPILSIGQWGMGDIIYRLPTPPNEGPPRKNAPPRCLSALWASAVLWTTPTRKIRNQKG
uniref:Uncharacterized protein n=1 Tax=Candidatus Kentrum sp. LPFa TaxID=2126335 RepID=A0A450WIL2_9GAMM|nr:MAG: hypothetical protein BECKLPF1236B_GA0070989_11043 [Candidatus Kentron sp. LPFa]